MANWEYHAFWFTRVAAEWNDVPEHARTWANFCANYLIPWENVVDWMNEMGRDGWEIFHVREEFFANWEEGSTAAAFMSSTTKPGLAAALDELGSGTALRDFLVQTNVAAPNADREVIRIQFYARRPSS